MFETTSNTDLLTGEELMKGERKNCNFQTFQEQKFFLKNEQQDWVLLRALFDRFLSRKQQIFYDEYLWSSP